MKSALLQDVYPIRSKTANMYNTPTILNALFEIFKLFMKKKTIERVNVFYIYLFKKKIIMHQLVKLTDAIWLL